MGRFLVRVVAGVAVIRCAGYRDENVAVDKVVVSPLLTDNFEGDEDPSQEQPDLPEPGEDTASEEGFDADAEAQAALKDEEKGDTHVFEFEDATAGRRRRRRRRRATHRRRTKKVVKPSKPTAGKLSKGDYVMIKDKFNYYYPCKIIQRPKTSNRKTTYTGKDIFTGTTMENTKPFTAEVLVPNVSVKQYEAFPDDADDDEFGAIRAYFYDDAGEQRFLPLPAADCEDISDEWGGMAGDTKTCLEVTAVQGDRGLIDSKEAITACTKINARTQLEEDTSCKDSKKDWRGSN